MFYMDINAQHFALAVHLQCPFLTLNSSPSTKVCVWQFAFSVRSLERESEPIIAPALNESLNELSDADAAGTNCEKRRPSILPRRNTSLFGATHIGRSQIVGVPLHFALLNQSTPYIRFRLQLGDLLPEMQGERNLWTVPFFPLALVIPLLP